MLSDNNASVINDGLSFRQKIQLSRPQTFLAKFFSFFLDFCAKFFKITVLGCVSGDGNYQKPVNPSDYVLGRSINGWILSDCFFSWLANNFYPSVKEYVTFPIIVFMDGHSSHMNVSVSEFCQNNGIILHCFPAHASHLMQPLDVSVYGPLKTYWNEALKDFSNQFPNMAMTKVNFFSVFDIAWKKAKGKPENAVSGFKKCGLIPFNPEALDYTKLIDSSTATRLFSSPLSPSSVSSTEMFTFLRCSKKMESLLPENVLVTYRRRLEKGYDVESDATASGREWNMYRWLHTNVNKNNISTPKSLPSCYADVLTPSETTKNTTNTTKIQTSNNYTSSTYNNIQKNIDCVKPAQYMSVTPTTTESDNLISGESNYSEYNDSVLSALNLTTTAPPSINNFPPESSVSLNKFYENWQYSPYKNFPLFFFFVLYYIFK